MFIKMFFLSREIRTYGMICLVGGGGEMIVICCIEYINFYLKYMSF